MGVLCGADVNIGESGKLHGEGGSGWEKEGKGKDLMMRTEGMDKPPGAGGRGAERSTRRGLNTRS